uniref:Uncharacterized protein n=1 Tax=Tanacetum cinerariifolium TaxID=118510 RepID=A0A6L2N4A5_TANCI|nr:hypothetical protein [Tanacetum cinerariifolium]
MVKCSTGKLLRMAKSEYDEEEQNVLYFNDLFPFIIIHPDDLKSQKDNGDDEVDTMQSLGRSQAPEKVIVTDLFYLRGWTLDRSKSLIYWLEILQGLTVVASALPVIDMAELVRLQICVEIDDTWALVAMGPERQHDAAAGTPGVAQDAPAIYEGIQAVLAPVQAPPPPPPPVAARTMP